KTFYGSTPEAVFSGFMNAKYSDEYGKIALLWEAGNGQRPSSFEDFKDRFVAFWVEYFFSDPRYMVIDNKLVMSIFGADKLPGSLGSTAAVKECFDYLREVVRGMGYDDIIIMACNGSSDPGVLKNYAAMGIDAVHAYNWGNVGYSAKVNQNNIFNQQKNGKGIIHNVPTVSTGFNNIAWAYTRHPNMTTDNMEQVLTWIRDYALKNYEITGEDDKWKQNFIMLSTWNEYGEGTYMMPSGLNGFGYVDTIRDVFTKGGAHEDERPDNLQMARLGYLYPINREIIRPQGYYEAPISGSVLLEDTFSGANFSHWSNSHSTVEDKGDVLEGVATDHDPILSWKMPYGSLDATTIKHIKVYVDGVVGDSVEVFWQREDDKTWTASKGSSSKITKEGMNPVIIDVSKNTNWKGTITSFRVDPITSANPFKVQKIEFLGEAAADIYQINGQTLKFDVNPVKLDNGDVLIPFFPDTGIGYQIGCAYTWDKVNNKLTLAKNGTTLVYTMGSDRASVNGVPETLECTPYLEDGLPMIPFKYTGEKLGCEFETKTQDGAAVTNLISISGKAYEILNSRVPDKWEFDLDGDTEGWTLQAATASVGEGS
ncbi:MAG: glycoside hydrolase family 99-like domain-containing protein, partial [Clostridia bacterium]|nr:glycoside hydrolase family 99-like domain-containing protein [Clostridia bacterium]